jgi:hypothetical protein
MSISWHERPRSRRDGRSRPNFKACPSEEQRYVVKHCSKNKPTNVMKWTGAPPTAQEIETYLRRKDWFNDWIAQGKKIVLAVLSTRPRPQHIATYVFYDKLVRQRIRRERYPLTPNHRP